MSFGKTLSKVCSLVTIVAASYACSGLRETRPDADLPPDADTITDSDNYILDADIADSNTITDTTPDTDIPQDSDTITDIDTTPDTNIPQDSDLDQTDTDIDQDEFNPNCFAEVNFTNVQSIEYLVRLAERDERIVTDTGATFHNAEPASFDEYRVQQGDLVLLEFYDILNETRVSRIIRYDSVDTINQLVLFTDIGTGGAINSQYTSFENDGSSDSINVGGGAFYFAISSGEGNPLAIALKNGHRLCTADLGLLDCFSGIFQVLPERREYLKLTFDCANECSNGLDDDGDGFVDMSDPDCPTLTDTVESTSPEVCDGIDNDGDGRIDVTYHNRDNYATPCITEDHCGRYDIACDTPHTHCAVLPRYPQGAMCVCDDGWQGCIGAAPCSIHSAEDPMNCGDCEITCGDDEICQEGLCYRP
jgi:hypothetical protein